MNALLFPMGSAALLAALFAIASVPLVKRLAEKAGAIREVRARDVHARPMPLWGGVSMFLAFVVSVLLLRPLVGQAFTVGVGAGQHPILGVLIGASLVAIVGMLDDKYDLKPSLQAGALLLGALVAALLGARIEGITNPFVPAPTPGGTGYTSANYIALGLWSYPLTMLWVFLAAKTFDFLDGLDGLAAGVCAIAATTMGLIAGARGEGAVALMASALAGACLGFLRYNYNPASIFMGTVGSQFLGFVLASLAVIGTVKAPTTVAVVIPLLVLGVPVFDGLYVVGRRVVQGKRPTEADRTHIHHRLRDRGLTVRQAVWAIYGLTGACCLAALLLMWHWSK